MQLPNTRNAKMLMHKISQQLLPIYESREAENIAWLVMEELFGFRRMDAIMQNTVVAEEADIQKLHEVVALLVKGCPVQYALGLAWFYGRKFEVNSAVLIPRPETEELVQLVLKDIKGKDDLRMLDIGTGSGCIAISLALESPSCTVFACDISDPALAMAQKNAENLQAGVQFFQCDILAESNSIEGLDVIVSNPPYVLNAEKVKMHKNVLDYEPFHALFVPDDDPLMFYRAIAKYGQKTLGEKGLLYFEINEAKGRDMLKLLQEMGYADCNILPDLHGKDRFVRACWRPGQGRRFY